MTFCDCCLEEHDSEVCPTCGAESEEVVTETGPVDNSYLPDGRRHRWDVSPYRSEKVPTRELDRFFL